MERKRMGIDRSLGTPVHPSLLLSLIPVNVEFVDSNVER